MKYVWIFLLTTTIWAQTRYPNLPTIPLDSKVEQKYEGVWPDSPFKDGDPTDAKFKRVEYLPPRIKLLVRAECSEQIGTKELVDAAKRLSSERGSLVQIDWERVNEEKVSFYVVVKFETRITRYTLKGIEGKYQVTDTKIQKDVNWKSQKLVFPSGSACVLEEDLPVRHMQLTLANLLNRLAVPHLNKTYPD